MKILLVDDHALFRAGLRLLLSTIQPDAQVFEAADAASALQVAREHPDLPLCLLDLALSEGHGLDALAALKQAAPEVAVVVSASTDGAVIRSCLDAGAMSFIPKSLGAQTLTHAVQQVLAGCIYLPEELLKTVAASHEVPQLTPRQLDVLAGLCRGLPSK